MLNYPAVCIVNVRREVGQKHKQSLVFVVALARVIYLQSYNPARFPVAEKLLRLEIPVW